VAKNTWEILKNKNIKTEKLEKQIKNYEIS